MNRTERARKKALRNAQNMAKERRNSYIKDGINDLCDTKYWANAEKQIRKSLCQIKNKEALAS